MKQHVTFEQLNELSEKGKEKLRKWWWSTLDETDRWIEKDTAKTLGWPRPMYAFNEFTVGKMIEFLDEHRRIIELENGTGLTIDREVIIKGKVICWYKKELCDALWEAVKEVLNG